MCMFVMFSLVSVDAIMLLKIWETNAHNKINFIFELCKQCYPLSLLLRVYHISLASTRFKAL